MPAKKPGSKGGGAKTAAKPATTSKAPAKKPVAAKKAQPAAKPSAVASAKAAPPAAPSTPAKKAAAPKAAAPKAPSKTKTPTKPAKSAVPSAVAEAIAALARSPSAVASTDVEEAVAPRPAPPPIPKSLPPRRADGTITLAHSPDADDAFMFYALAAGKVETEDRKYEHILKDIQTLNERAKTGEYDVTALSFHAYPHVRQNYRLLTCGASFGDGYGPVLVAKTPIRSQEVDGLTIAIPGEWTTAALVTRLYFGRNKIRPIAVPFDKIVDAVRSGLTRAGVLIHEAQLTYKAQGLVRVVDFGQWWTNETEGLPLPLGGNGIRRDLPKALVSKIALDLKRSIAYALGHREEALNHAMTFARDLPRDQADKFVGLYVNDLTLDYGERGRQALLDLYSRARRAGFLADEFDPEFVE